MFEKVDQLLTIDQFDRRDPVAYGLFPCLCGERSGRQDQPLVCTTHHGAAEVSNQGRPDRVLVPLALEEHFECHEWIQFEDPVSLDPSITRAPGYSDPLESGLPEQALTQAFEPLGGKFLEQGEQLDPVITFRCLGSKIRLRVDSARTSRDGSHVPSSGH